MCRSPVPWAIGNRKNLSPAGAGSYISRQALPLINGPGGVNLPHTRSGLARKGKRPWGKLRTQLHILQGLPGIGPERARLLLEVFGSVEAVLTASEEALRSVDGIGTTTVKRICWAIREPESVYGVAGRSFVGSGHHVPS
jgi:hypothetical protein